MGFVETLVHYRCFEQILHDSRIAGRFFVSVIVAVLAGVENGWQCLQGGVGDLGVDGGLAAGLVPQDLQGMSQLNSTSGSGP